MASDQQCCIDIEFATIQTCKELIIFCAQVVMLAYKLLCIRIEVLMTGLAQVEQFWGNLLDEMQKWEKA